MNTMNYEKAIALIQKDDRGKDDMMAQANTIRMDKNGHLIANGEKFTLSDNAMSQVFGKVGMPTLYEKRLLEINPKLVADQYNYLLEKAGYDRPMLLRYKEQNRKKTLRAMLSDSYSPLDNYEIYETLGDVLGGLKDLEVETMYLDDNRSRMRIIIPSMTQTVGKALKKDDVLKVGFDVINSETGRSSLQISPLVYRLVCLNGLKVWQNEGDVFRQRHAYAQASDLKDNMKSAINNAIRNGDVLIGKFVETKEQEVDDPMALIENLSKKKDYSDKFIELTKSNWKIEPDRNMYGVINAFTRSAQSLDDERRIDVENFAGTLVSRNKS